mgnify:CR=1 FL=1
MIYFAIFFLLLTAPAQAAVLLWDTPTTGLITIERGVTETGPFEFVATLEVPPDRQFPLLSGNWGFYRITQAGVTSNVVRFSLDLYTGTITDRLDALEARVNALVTPVVIPPPPVISSNLLTTRQIDSTHVELVCVGTSMKTTGSGLRRVVECLP